jgi:outer membrane receptor protein involved in Fe transport
MLVITERGAQMANSIVSSSARTDRPVAPEWPRAILSFFCNRRYSLLSAALMLAVAASALLAQSTGKISGTVKDAASGEPLIGANVVILGTSLGASTDLDGNYFILNIPTGRYSIQASMIGYQRVIQRDVIVDIGRTTAADFQLKASAIEQEAVVVEATRPDVEREKTSTSEIIRSEDVQQIAGMRDINDVIGLAADVTDGHFRGGRTGEELYTLQGMGIVNPLDNSTALLPIMSAVEEVEVITSGFGAQYGNAQSGVVNITMKEGKSDKWRSHAEINVRMPGRKHFGGSFFDTQANPYLRTMMTDSVWNSPNNPESPGLGYWTSMGGNLGGLVANDTAAQIAVARALWLQSRMRYLNNTSFENNIDYWGEFSAGGPISETMRMFIAARNTNTWPVYPAEQPEIQRQFMGNIVADLSNGASLRLDGAYSEDNSGDYPSENSSTSPGFYRFLYEDILSVQYEHVTNSQIGLRFSKAINPRTFYVLKLSTLLTRRQEGSSPYISDLSSSQLGNLRQNNLMIQPVSAPDGFTVGYGTYAFYDDKTTTNSLDASMTSQVTKSHLLNGGIQANLYNLNINEHLNMNQDPPYYNIYTANPWEASFYIQDKMEFEGMIANVGLRWDLWDENVKYNPDRYNIYSLDSGATYIGPSAFTKSTPLAARLQPRVGISFPVSVSTVFHINYGSFMQRPSFQYIFNSRNQMYSPQTPNTIGNPTLKPQTTYSYDVGVMQGLGEGFTLDVSGYYKNVRDLVQSAIYAGANGTQSYTTYINYDYADIRGFRIVLNKRKGSFVGSLNYQFSVATGKSSSVGSFVPSFVEGRPVDLTNTSKKDILMDFDRTHKVLLNLAYVTDENWGVKIGKIYPLGDISISTLSYLQSGRPYSYNAGLGQTEANNKRTPLEQNTNLKISKRIRNFFGVDASVYLEVFNLFDNKILNYNYVFLSDAFGQPNNNVKSYETIPLNAPNGLLNQNGILSSQLNLDKSFLVYDNAPRSFNIGISVDF